MWHKAWLRSLLCRFNRRSTGRLRRKRNTAALYRIEALEPRVLLSATGPETHVDDNNAATIPHGAVAIDGAGNYVITWIENVPGQTVYAQRYNSAGVPQGDRIVVSPNRSPQNPAIEVFPSGAQVAIDNSGNFVVTFMANDTTNSIYAQRYNNFGQTQGSLIHINSDNFGDGDVFGRIAMDADGDFVVSW